MKRFATPIVFALIAVLMLGAVGTVAAQGPDGDDGPPAAGPEGGERGPRGENGERGDRGQRNGNMRFNFGAAPTEAEVAAALGISVEEFEAYLDANMSLRDIAQELDINIDNVQETLRASTQAERNAQLAAAFGISVEELEAYLDADMSLRDIAQELDVNYDNVQQTLRESTQAERAEILANALGISVEELASYREQDMSLAEIITELGLDEATVLDNLPFNGVGLRLSEERSERQERQPREGRGAPNGDEAPQAPPAANADGTDA